MKQNFDSEQLESENEKLKMQIDDISQILGVARNADLGDYISKMKLNIEDLREDNQELSNMLDQMKQGQFNQASAGKMISNAEESQLKNIVAETEQRFQDLEHENRRLRSEIEKQS